MQSVRSDNLPANHLAKLLALGSQGISCHSHPLSRILAENAFTPVPLPVERFSYFG